MVLGNTHVGRDISSLIVGLRVPEVVRIVGLERLAYRVSRNT
jgi:hypothetical protein